MARAGHEVDLVTAGNKDHFEKIINEGVTVHYLPVQYDNSFGFARRLWSFYQFVNKALHYVAGLGKFDIAYITSTPLTVGIIALRLKKKYKLSYIFEVRDLWPEAPIQAGIIRSVFLKKIARYLESRTYSGANKLVALSPGIAGSFSGKTWVPVHLCTNISDCNFFGITTEKNRELSEKYSLDDDFVIGYFGALGKMNALTYLLDAANYFKLKAEKIKFLIIGNGGQKSHLQRIADRNNLDNVIFVEHLDKFQLREHLSLIDAAYVSFAKLKVLESNSPNKFFDALASGKLIILNMSGWLREIVEKNKCGFYADPEAPGALLNQLQPFIHNRLLLAQYQRNARKLAENNFEREKLTIELLKFIEK